MRHFPRIALAALIGALILPAQVVAAARAEALDMDEKDRALVAKETLKGKKAQAGAQGSGKGNGKSSSCGSVDIGNSDANKKGGSRIAEREKTVIVTGNVFNTANCK